MHKPPVLSLLALLTISIAGAGYAVFLVENGINQLFPVLTTLVTACILLGLMQVYLVHQIRQLHQHAFSTGDSVVSANGSLAMKNRFVKRSWRPDSHLQGEQGKQAEHKIRQILGERRLEDASAPTRFTTEPHTREAGGTDRRFDRLHGALVRSNHSGPKRAPDKIARFGDGHTSDRKEDETPWGEGANGEQYQISLVGTNEIVLSSPMTGEQRKFPCESREAIELAWRAFANGAKVKPVIESGRITRLQMEQSQS